MKEKKDFKKICEKMAMLMIISEYANKTGKFEKNIAIPKDWMHLRFNYFYNHLFNHTKSVKELEKEFIKL